MQLIGLKGLKGAGKDAVADYLVERYGFTKLSFARPMKGSAAACLGAGNDPLFFEEMKNNPNARIKLEVDGVTIIDISVREYLQFFGTQGHRQIPEFGENVWVDMLGFQLTDEDGKYVMPDSRFENECKAIRDNGGTVIQIIRDAVVDGDAHESEAPIDPALIDTDLFNNGTLEDLYATVDAYMAISGALVQEGVTEGVAIAEVGR